MPMIATPSGMQMQAQQQPQITPNALAQWIDFYKQSMPYSSGNYGQSMFGTVDAGPSNYEGAALNFAQSMLQGARGGNGGNGGPPQATPDFFANVPGGANAPIQSPDVGEGYNRLLSMLRPQMRRY